MGRKMFLVEKVGKNLAYGRECLKASVTREWWKQQNGEGGGACSSRALKVKENHWGALSRETWVEMENWGYPLGAQAKDDGSLE